MGTSCGLVVRLLLVDERPPVVDGVLGLGGDPLGVNGAKYGLAPTCARRSCSSEAADDDADGVGCSPEVDAEAPEPSPRPEGGRSARNWSGSASKSSSSSVFGASMVRFRGCIQCV
ncbi:hypothetical protein F442_13289 [Phytophthora nicotianae P10297]|uniref:Uncharacterized protein n=1 Tax=Phytophthora nicotianae P10297 TaxID=1317064 RepID=W2YZ72_PHYNI|nr:hypothetical protein F442_13289 [Phytophthora nicotianae P10297]